MIKIKQFTFFSRNYQFCTYRILFFGSDNISEHVLRSINIYQNGVTNKVIDNLEVATYQSLKKNENPFENFSLKNNINVHIPLKREKTEHKKNWKQFLNSHGFQSKQFNLGIVCSYGYMIPSQVIDAFEHGMIVIHPSLLPQYRGASPIQYSLLNGDKMTGVSFIDISKKEFDAGKILLQNEMVIQDNHNYGTLSNDLAKLAGKSVTDLLENLEEYRFNGKLQDNEFVTKAPKFQLQETYVDWNQDSNIKVINKFRAFQDTNFGSVKTVYDGKTIFLEDMQVPSQEEIQFLEENYKNAVSGSQWIIRKFKKQLYVKCQQGWIEIIKLRFYDKQLSQENYKFVNQYIKKDVILSDPEALAHYKFENFQI